MTTSTRRSSRRDAADPALLGLLPGRPDTLAFSVAAIVVVLAFGLLISKTAAMTRLDLAGSVAVTTLHTGLFAAVGSAVYALFSPAEAIGLTFVIAVVIALTTRSLRLAATFAATIALTWIPSDVVKIIVDRPRPDRSALSHHLVTLPVDPSYPSGHMVFVTTLAIVLVFLSARTRWNPAAVVLGVLAVVVVAVSLVSDGVHYPSDVLASIVWSLGVAPLVLALWNRFVLPRTYRNAARHQTDHKEPTA